ncbi:receptor-like serine/threonine-protein kinase ALE2 isoform X2 [Phoenix dactylifera]|uniref:Receptor-like serine/threonine-protein kinase ALE2 isoform X2 n=1 Tax=Phoenix dactylifera TaxID=42345 RepID=A0A8B8ZC80_PHODC|nr:receptor-like serine/threonine-protein kinase ALE2 isoform X2 [Phoenix dactylifera]
MRVLVMLMLLLVRFHLGSLAFGTRTLSPASNPSSPPEMWTIAPSLLGPTHAPFHAKYHGPIRSPHVWKHQPRIPNVVSPSSFVPPQSQELEVEVAAGTFLKQSQVKIMAALGSSQDQQKTRVTIYLVPLGENFDHMTALLIYERFWQKKVPINMPIFGNYEVIDVNYPGFPSSPPFVVGGSTGFGLGDTGRHQHPFTADVPTGGTQKLSAGIIAVIVVASVTIVLGCFITILFYCKVIKLSKPVPAEGPTNSLSVAKRSGIKFMTSNSLAGSSSVLCVSRRANHTPSVKTFSLVELEKATYEFSSKRILGEGGFGRVYHGIMEDGSEVAIKLLTRGDQNGDCEFIAEVEMLSRLYHRNLVKLIGICIEGNRRCLVYELVRNGSVESHLHGADRKKGPLDWDARIKIALGAARGLAYLHEDSNPCVIHRDFKASNILLEEDYTPKVTDFGLAREASEGGNHISTRVVGTFGYVAPEYAMTGHLTVKSDVYSYGIVLLELLSGREPVYVSESQMPVSLVTWARPLLTSREGLEQLIDPSLHGNSNFNDVASVAAIASKCIRIEPSQRPFMGEVVQALKLVYKGMDETCEDSQSQRGSSSCRDYGYMGDVGPEYSWWRNGCSPNLAYDYGHTSPFMTMECSLDSMDEKQRPHSTSSLTVEYMSGHNRSGPLRTKRKRTSLYGLRGSTSEVGHLSWHLGIDGHYVSSL